MIFKKSAQEFKKCLCYLLVVSLTKLKSKFEIFDCDVVNIIKELAPNTEKFIIKMGEKDPWLDYLKKTVKETSKCYKKDKVKENENNVDFIFHEKYAYKFLPGIEKASDIKQKINEAIKLINGVKATERRIVLILSNTNQMCKGLMHFYQDTPSMPTSGSCPTQWKDTNPYEIPQWEEKLLNASLNKFLEVHVHITGKGSNQLLYAVINMTEADKSNMMKRSEGVT